VRVVLLDEAQHQFEAEDTWWREHRDAKDLFAEEFERALWQLATAPELGQRYRRKRGKLIQRQLMTKTRCHVYYFHDVEQNRVEIHSVWGARRQRGPKL
jgi:plasmid stabilization system protein ParE